MLRIFLQDSALLVVFFASTSILVTNVETENVKVEALDYECGSDGDCLSTPVDCDTKCGCDEAYFYNETTKECVLDVQHLMKASLTIYDPVDPNNANDNSMSANIGRQSDKVFKGMTVAVIIIGTSALICIVSACFYCCRINYSDRRLRGDVKALAKKLHRDQKIKKSLKTPRKLEEESCNVVVQDAGVFVC